MHKPETCKLTVRKVIELKIKGVDTPTLGNGTQDQQTVILAIETCYLQEQIDNARLPELATGTEAGTILLTVRAAETHTPEVGKLEAFMVALQKGHENVTYQLAMSTALKHVKPCPLMVSVQYGASDGALAELQRLGNQLGFVVMGKPEKVDFTLNEQETEALLLQSAGHRAASMPMQ